MSNLFFLQKYILNWSAAYHLIQASKLVGSNEISHSVDKIALADDWLTDLSLTLQEYSSPIIATQIMVVVSSLDW